jgi:hemerythrin-like domain-containing protein
MAGSDERSALSLAVVIPGMTGTHKIFRRELPLTSDLVRRVADGDTGRAGLLAKHLRLVLDLVQVHHDAEERFIWSVLPERAPESRELVDTMLRQHADVHDAAEMIESRRGGWATSPDAASGQALAEAVEAFTRALVAHADLEEGEPLPIIADHLSPAEWGEFVAYASTAMPEEARPTVMGMLMEDMPDPAREAFLANLPDQLAEFLRTTGAKAYAEYTAAIRAA